MSRSYGEESLADARESLTNARRAAEAAIGRAESQEVAFAVASELATAYREVADEMTGYRVREAARLRDAESLSLAGLAKRLGISKARAEQLVNMAKAQNSPSDSED